MRATLVRMFVLLVIALVPLAVRAEDDPTDNGDSFALLIVNQDYDGALDVPMPARDAGSHQDLSQGAGLQR